jgi:protein phosphatase
MIHEPDRSVDDPRFLPPPLPPLTGPRVQVDVAALSHPGRVRENNEDHFLVARTGRSIDLLASNLAPELIPEHIADHGYAYIVADGLGGMAAGEYASQLALQAGIARVLQSDHWCFRADRRTGPALMRRIREYFLRVDHVLLQHARASPALEGMATTLTVVYTIGADGFVAHAGDSRAYLFRDGGLRRLTCDHTWAQYLADSGLITPEEVATHNRRHIVLNCAGGTSAGIEPQIEPFQLADGDTLLLCTDGLTEMVNESTIAEILRETRRSDDACRELVDRALAHGGKDNVTVVVARYAIPQNPGPPWFLAADPEATVDF